MKVVICIRGDPQNLLPSKILRFTVLCFFLYDIINVLVLTLSLLYRLNIVFIFTQI